MLPSSSALGHHSARAARAESFDVGMLCNVSAMAQAALVAAAVLRATRWGVHAGAARVIWLGSEGACVC